MIAISDRWYPLREHPIQLEWCLTKHRFCVVPAGRRSGKTERAKRKLVKKALSPERLNHNQRPQFFAGAPTYNQAKRIFWEDLKELSKPFWSRKPLEQELIIELITGARIFVLGMDKPERIEGTPWDGGVLDEFADISPKAWGAHVRPALADRNGWCDLIGVPEGRNHYYHMAERAIADMAINGPTSEWGHYTWLSSDILSAEEIAAAKRDLDPQTFEQEYEAKFVNFSGRAYYTFTDENKIPGLANLYRPDRPLILCFDFNVEPGVAVIVQEMPIKTLDIDATVVIGEVHIPRNSTTPAICRKILQDWNRHYGDIYLYGDATGGSRGSAQTEGSDWDIIKDRLRHGDGDLSGFTGEIFFNVPNANPTERARVNAMNTRMCNGAGRRSLFVDQTAAPKLVLDLEGVALLEGGSGEIDKRKDKSLTHISDALGYYIAEEYPIDGVADKWQETYHQFV